MAAEAECVSRAMAGVPEDARPLVAVAGANGERAYESARTLVARKVAGVLSLGLAGGLDPVLQVGSAVLADAVLLPDGSRIHTDADWRRGLAAVLGTRVVIGAIAGQNTVAATARAKAALRAATGAVAADNPNGYFMNG